MARPCDPDEQSCRAEYLTEVAPHQNQATRLPPRSKGALLRNSSSRTFTVDSARGYLAACRDVETVVEGFANRATSRDAPDGALELEEQ